MKFSKKDCDFVWDNLDQQFQTIREDWIDKLLWIAPHKAQLMMNTSERGKRNNHHIVDITHRLAHRSFTAGFMEGNTSSTRDWMKLAHPDPDLNAYEPAKQYIQNLTRRTLSMFSSSNLYHALSLAYYDYGAVDTAVIYIDELTKGPHFTVLDPGTYRLVNDFTGTAQELMREFPMTIKSLVEKYGKKKNGEWDWSNFSQQVKNAYERSDYALEIMVRERLTPNKNFNNDIPEGGANRKWVGLTYEAGGVTSNGSTSHLMYGDLYGDEGREDDKFLRIQNRTRKPFIAFRNQSSSNFPYGQTGPTTDSLGLIKSLNKKAIGKDVALDLMLNPPTQGPASLRKSYVTTQPRGHVPLNPNEAYNGGLKPIFQVDRGISQLNADVMDLRQMIGKMYYEDYLLFLAKNPKTRTATEVDAIMREQQLVLGPVLQSLDHTLNNPLVDFGVDYTLFNDPYIGEAPPELQGEMLRTIFISVFAQSQRAADLPAVDRYMAMINQVGQINPAIFDKANIDVYADIYADRLYLPAGLNRPQKEVDARRAKNQADMQRQQALQETLPQVAKAAKDINQAQALERDVTAE